MAKKKNIDNRKQLLVRFRIDEKGQVNFIDPCCDDIPAVLFNKVLEALTKVENEWNSKLHNDMDKKEPIMHNN